MKRTGGENVSFPLFFTTGFALENFNIYVDNSMDCSSDRKLLGNTGETDIDLKKTNQMRSTVLLDVSTNYVYS